MSVGTMKGSFGGLSGQRFVPSTITLKVMSTSEWFCTMCSLKEPVKLSLRCMSTALVSNRFAFDRREGHTSEHVSKFVRVFETASSFQFRYHVCLALV